ncbi:uncharacterized protein H6S33_010839 [Morchella sextelata]|uniref:uncharacterized protein n=1 Tax=Morchella sextelata TaxID=1174677 RepID=UPI001D03A63F|nr:uncharacterized protein H6S33_010839 [Morchella sextelata]KAH0611574.1 hypothetical protein H6S33_010839 [Morchella sextelata]
MASFAGLGPFSEVKNPLMGVDEYPELAPAAPCSLLGSLSTMGTDSGAASEGKRCAASPPADILVCAGVKLLSSLKEHLSPTWILNGFSTYIWPLQHFHPSSRLKKKEVQEREERKREWDSKERRDTTTDTIPGRPPC